MFLFISLLFFSPPRTEGIDRANRLLIVGCLAPLRHKGINKPFVHRRYAHNLLQLSTWFSYLCSLWGRSARVAKMQRYSVTKFVTKYVLGYFYALPPSPTDTVAPQWSDHFTRSLAFCAATKPNPAASRCRGKLPNIQIMYANYCWLLLINDSFWPHLWGKQPTALSHQYGPDTCLMNSCLFI